MASGQRPCQAETLAESSCVECHSDIADETKGSIHSQQAISCHHCHGGDPTKEDQDLAMSPEAGYIGVPDKRQIAERCGACHADVETMNFYGIRTDQLARYKTSHHGKKLLLEGDTRVAVCSDCHGYHTVLPVGDPASPVYPLNLPKTCNKCHGNEKLMAGYNLPSDIFKTYESSVHGKALFEKKDLSVANCASCHGSHGAVPPGVKDVATTCGKCHVNERKYFLESVHAKAHAEGKFSECISCHGNHGVQKPTPVLYEEACVKCHEPGSQAAGEGLKIHEALRKANEEFEEAEGLVRQASIEGIFVEDESALLEVAKSDLVSMAPLQHTLSTEKISGLETNVFAKVSEINASIQNKRENLKRRKLMLIPIWIFVFIMSAALLGKYHELRHKKKKGNG